MNPTLKRGLVAALIAAILGGIFVIASGGPSNAAALITGKKIQNQSIYSVDIAAGGVGTSELRDGNTFFKDLSKGTQDLINSKASKTQAQGYANKAEANAKGHANQVADSAENAAKGYADANDEVGFNTARAGAGYTKFAEPGYSVVYGKCAEGKVAISGGYRLNGHASESFSGADQQGGWEGLTVIASEPAAFKNDGLVNAYQDPAFPQTESGSFQANAWAVTIHNDNAEPKAVRVWATCVNL